MKRDTLALRVVAVFLLGAGLYHLVGALAPTFAPRLPTWRHGLFAAVDLVAAVGLWRDFRGFSLLFAVLTAQQLWSHGGDLLRAATVHHRLDALSLVVVLLMPGALALVLRRARGHTPPTV
ncbi:MAG: hypothetical protein HY909_03525 [Deltaproteobacteria bacterium]|nr:hypothetical protein [Deltaproteobacteria bacterium]